MRINWVYVNEYKNLKNQKIVFQNNTSNVYVLVGKNGSGKSNIIEALSYIFSSLFKDPLHPAFAYGISYTIDSKTVEIEWLLQLDIKVNEEKVRYDYLVRNKLLPNRVVSVYSGEESRLWEDIYKPFYDDYINELSVGKSNESLLKLLYVNKYHWNISLLTLALSETYICQEFLRDLNIEIDYVSFFFDYAKVNANREPKLKVLLEELIKQNIYSIEQLRSILKRIMYGFDSDSLMLNDYDVFEYFFKGNIPKNFKTIENIKLSINHDYDMRNLSEGEKKRILIFMAMHVISTENSIILLDEPDVFLHPSWQKKLVNDINKLSMESFVLLTTHSPNVISGTEKDSIIRINNGIVFDNTIPTYGRDISSLQAEIFEEHIRNDDIELQIRSIYDLINRGELDEAEALVNKLASEKMGPNDMEIIKIKTMIEFEREFI